MEVDDVDHPLQQREVVEQVDQPIALLHPPPLLPIPAVLDEVVQFGPIPTAVSAAHQFVPRNLRAEQAA